MSATPHNGSDADFQLFMGLLDADRFEGRPREGARKIDVSDLMRRLTKEELPEWEFKAGAFHGKRQHFAAMKISAP